jgi:hypothetical protein
MCFAMGTRGARNRRSARETVQTPEGARRHDYCFSFRPSNCSTLVILEVRRRDAALEQREDVVQFAFDDRAHRMQPVVESAAIDEVEATGHEGRHALAKAERRDAEFQ